MTGKQKRNNVINLIFLGVSVILMIVEIKSSEHDWGWFVFCAIMYVCWMTVVVREWPKSKSVEPESLNKTDDLKKIWKDKL